MKFHQIKTFRFKKMFPMFPLFPLFPQYTPVFFRTHFLVIKSVFSLKDINGDLLGTSGTTHKKISIHAARGCSHLLGTAWERRPQNEVIILLQELKLRPYQTDALHRTREAFRSGYRRPLVVLHAGPERPFCLLTWHHNLRRAEKQCGFWYTGENCLIKP